MEKSYKDDRYSFIRSFRILDRGWSLPGCRRVWHLSISRLKEHTRSHPLRYRYEWVERLKIISLSPSYVFPDQNSDDASGCVRSNARSSWGEKKTNGWSRIKIKEGSARWYIISSSSQCTYTCMYFYVYIHIHKSNSIRECSRHILTTQLKGRKDRRGLSFQYEPAGTHHTKMISALSTTYYNSLWYSTSDRAFRYLDRKNERAYTRRVTKYENWKKTLKRKIRKTNDQPRYFLLQLRYCDFMSWLHQVNN